MKSFIVFSLIIILLFVIIEFLQKKLITKFSWSRKATHISVGLIVMLFPTYLTVLQICIMAVLFFIVLIISRRKSFLSLHFSKRQSWGEIIYPITIAVVALISLPENPTAFYIGILCLSLSDSLANIVGTYLPIKDFVIFKHHKSLGGSLAFFISTLLILYFFLLPFNANVFVIIAIALLLTVVETFSFFGLDNLTVPLIASLLVMMIL